MRVGISAFGILGTGDTVTKCLHAAVICGEMNVKEHTRIKLMLRTACSSQDAITIGVGVRKDGLISYINIMKKGVQWIATHRRVKANIEKLRATLAGVCGARARSTRKSHM